jgi:hypothetical protein
MSMYGTTCSCNPEDLLHEAEFLEVNTLLAQLVKYFTPLSETQVSLLCLQKSVTGPPFFYLNRSVRTFLFCLRLILILHISEYIGLPRGLFPFS